MHMHMQHAYDVHAHVHVHVMRRRSSAMVRAALASTSASTSAATAGPTSQWGLTSPPSLWPTARPCPCACCSTAPSPRSPPPPPPASSPHKTPRHPSPALHPPVPSITTLSPRNNPPCNPSRSSSPVAAPSSPIASTPAPARRPCALPTGARLMPCVSTPSRDTTSSGTLPPLPSPSHALGTPHRPFTMPRHVCAYHALPSLAGRGRAAQPPAVPHTLRTPNGFSSPSTPLASPGLSSARSRSCASMQISRSRLTRGDLRPARAELPLGVVEAECAHLVAGYLLSSLPAPRAAS